MQFLSFFLDRFRRKLNTAEDLDWHFSKTDVSDITLERCREIELSNPVWTISVGSIESIVVLT